VPVLAISLFVNILAFWLLFNLPWLLRDRRPGAGDPPQRQWAMPLALGIALTVLDALRVQFLLQMGVLAGLGALMYWGRSIFLRR
jgi:hypothetical protein